jgi:hypothetical protein
LGERGKCHLSARARFAGTSVLRLLDAGAFDKFRIVVEPDEALFLCVVSEVALALAIKNDLVARTWRGVYRLSTNLDAAGFT